MGAEKAHSTAARLNTLRTRDSAVGRRSNLVSLNAGDALRQGGALGDGKVVHHLVGFSA